MLFIQLRSSPKFGTLLEALLNTRGLTNCLNPGQWPTLRMPTSPWSARRPDRKSSQEGELHFLRYFVSKRYLSERWRGRRSKHRRWGENQRQRLPPSDVHPGRVHVQPKQWCWAHCGWPRPCSPWRGSSPWRAGLALSIRWWGSVVRPLGTVWHSFEWHGFAEFLLHISLDIQVQRGSRAEQIFHQARRYWVQPYANSTKMLVSMMKSWLKLGMKELLEDKWWYRNVSKSENRSTQLLKLSDFHPICGKATTTVVTFSSLGSYPRAAPHLLQLLDPAGGSFAIWSLTLK